jgi:hypothetical protein
MKKEGVRFSEMSEEDLTIVHGVMYHITAIFVHRTNSKFIHTYASVRKEPKWLIFVSDLRNLVRTPVRNIHSD